MVRAQWLATIAILIANLASGGAPREQGRAEAPRRILLVPRFQAGQSLHYQFDLRTTTVSHSTGPIANPEAASALNLIVSALVRLDVVSVTGAGERSAGQVRLRTTYEKSAATSHSDAYDPDQDDLEKRYRDLEGHSFEFTVEPDGKVADVRGLDAAVADPASRRLVEGWLSGIAQGAALPPDGIAIGQKWSMERPNDMAPLAGLVWRTDSTYVRDEPCRAIPNAAEISGGQEICAIIETKFQIDNRHVPRDPTPEEFRRNSLRTSGTWSGSADSLNAISRRTGFVVSVSQNGTEEMDVTIANLQDTSKMHYAGRVETHSEITLLPEATAGAPVKPATPK